MLKEEKDCRWFIRAALHNTCDYPMAYRLLTEVIRAVRADERERCAKVCEEGSSPAKITNAGAFYAEIIRGMR